MLQVPVPEQAPLQPLKIEPDAGVAARLTLVPEANVAEHVAPQLMPAGALVTDPLPVPAREMVKVTRGWNVAVTAMLEFISTVHVPVPLQAPPLHPANTELPCGEAVRVTLDPVGNVLEQFGPQLIPDGELLTLPFPAPDLVRVRVKLGAGEKVAETLTAAAPTVNVQVPVPEHPAPLQPAKTSAGLAGVAVNVTDVPLLKLDVQVGPQLIPAGALATVPDPVPDSVTVTGNDAGMKIAPTD